MIRLFTFFCFFFCIKYSFGQKSIDNLIQAEKNFAAYSVVHSTKEAFQQFIDSNSIMFDEGKPVKAIDYWNKREIRPGILNWQPQYAEISMSGNFGYTTGPWTFQQKTIHDSVVARGQYTTVWHINKNGEWKFLVDLGSNNTPVNVSNDIKKITAVKRKAKTAHNPEMIKAEKNFIKLLNQNRTAAYKKYLSGESLLNRNGILPASKVMDKKGIIDSMTFSVEYTISGSGISPSFDMGYVYGTTVINNKTENYLRIWRKEKSGWKIALEVLRY
jgi:ketosteroid isomerase-like protein